MIDLNMTKEQMLEEIGQYNSPNVMSVDHPGTTGSQNRRRYDLENMACKVLGQSAVNLGEPLSCALDIASQPNHSRVRVPVQCRVYDGVDGVLYEIPCHGYDFVTQHRRYAEGARRGYSPYLPPLDDDGNAYPLICQKDANHLRFSVLDASHCVVSWNKETSSVMILATRARMPAAARRAG